MRATASFAALTIRSLSTFLLGAIALNYTLAAELAHAVDEMEELYVIGKVPGPKLWKRVNGENVLWVMGIIELLPKAMDWDDKNVENIIMQSSVMLTPPSISSSESNPLNFLKSYRRFKKSQLPKGSKLSDILNESRQEDYQRISNKFKVRTNRKLRPVFAAERLEERSLKRAGLQSSEPVIKHLHKLAKRHSLNVLDSIGEIEIEQILEIIESLPLETELKCFDAILESLEQSIEHANVRAIAWANGDLSNIGDRLTNSEIICENMLLDYSTAKTANSKSRLAWLKHATEAMQANPVSFAILPIEEVLAPAGLWSELKTLLE